MNLIDADTEMLNNLRKANLEKISVEGPSQANRQRYKSLLFF